MVRSPSTKGDSKLEFEYAQLWCEIIHDKIEKALKNYSQPLNQYEEEETGATIDLHLPLPPQLNEVEYPLAHEIVRGVPYQLRTIQRPAVRILALQCARFNHFQILLDQLIYRPTSLPARRLIDIFGRIDSAAAGQRVIEFDYEAYTATWRALAYEAVFPTYRWSTKRDHHPTSVLSAAAQLAAGAWALQPTIGRLCEPIVLQYAMMVFAMNPDHKQRFTMFHSWRFTFLKRPEMLMQSLTTQDANMLQRSFQIMLLSLASDQDLIPLAKFVGQCLPFFEGVRVNQAKMLPTDLINWITFSLLRHGSRENLIKFISAMIRIQSVQMDPIPDRFGLNVSTIDMFSSILDEDDVVEEDRMQIKNLLLKMMPLITNSIEKVAIQLRLLVTSNLTDHEVWRATVRIIRNAAGEYKEYAPAHTNLTPTVEVIAQLTRIIDRMDARNVPMSVLSDSLVSPSSTWPAAFHLFDPLLLRSSDEFRYDRSSWSTLADQLFQASQNSSPELPMQRGIHFNAQSGNVYLPTIDGRVDEYFQSVLYLTCRALKRSMEFAAAAGLDAPPSTLVLETDTPSEESTPAAAPAQPLPPVELVNGMTRPFYADWRIRIDHEMRTPASHLPLYLSPLYRAESALARVLGEVGWRPNGESTPTQADMRVWTFQQ